MTFTGQPYISISSKIRLLARLRRRYPLLFFLPGLIVGQTLAYEVLFSKCPILVALGGVCAFLLLLRARRLLLAVSFLAGIMSFVPTLPSRPATLSSEKSYLVKVVREPRHPRVGQLLMDLDFVAEAHSTTDDQAVRALDRSIRARCKAVELPWKNIAHAQAGSFLIIRAQIHPVRPGANPLSFDATLFRHGVQAECRVRFASIPETKSRLYLSEIRAFIRETAFAILGDGESAGLVLALSVGARDLLSEETEQAFKATGLAHLLVASGYQVTLLFAAVFTVARVLLSLAPYARRFDCLRTVAALIGLSASCLFVAIVGLEGSVIRALCAILVAVGVQIFERGASFFNSILLSFLFVAVVWPGCYFEPGVQLTFAALSGLALASGGSKSSFILTYLRACCLACLATSIVSLAWFSRLTFWTFILNPLLAPFGAFVGCKLALAALALAASGIDPSGYFLQVIAWSLERYRDLICTLADFEYGGVELTGPPKWAALTAFSLGWLYLLQKHARRYEQEFNLGAKLKIGANY